jgi:hypothetical protein
MQYNTTRLHYITVQVDEKDNFAVVTLDTPELIEFETHPRTFCVSSGFTLLFSRKIFGTREEIAALFPYFNEKFRITARELPVIKALATTTKIEDDTLWYSIGFKELFTKDSKDTLDNLLQFLYLIVKMHYGKLLGI